MQNWKNSLMSLGCQFGPVPITTGLYAGGFDRLTAMSKNDSCAGMGLRCVVGDNARADCQRTASGGCAVILGSQHQAA